MSKPFTDFTGQFFWSFKRMDNVNYNFEILEKLYEAKKAALGDRHLNKPIIITVAAMIECMLYDFLVRIKQHTADQVPNVSERIKAYIKGMDPTDEFAKIIGRLRSQNLLNVPAGSRLYDELDELREVRNRVHIQNAWGILEADEKNVYSNARVDLAQTSLETVIDTLCNVFPRGGAAPISMSELPRPWL